MELLVVVAIFGIVAVIALPVARPAVRGYEVAGQAHAVAYDIALAKMQAAAGFTQARLYADLSANSYRVKVWDKTTNAWTTRGALTPLPSGIGFGYGSVSTAPTDTQGTFGQAEACRDASGTAVADTSCVLFNSRGAPIDHNGAATGNDAIYLTNGDVVYGVTVSLAGLTQLWWTPTYTTSWQKQ